MMTAQGQQLSALLRLDLENEWVWCGEQCLRLTPKSFSVLRYLVEHAGRLVAKGELFSALWPGTAVSDDALVVCIREIRKMLRDQAQAPHYIETVHRRGYRFIGPLTTTAPPVSVLQSPVPGQHSAIHLVERAQDRIPQFAFVGRKTELERLHGWREEALTGERQVIFVSGEAGIGKTALVDAFVASLRPEIWVGRGQCVEHYAAGEAYLPVLEALGRLGRGPQGRRLIELLSCYAPTWLVQMPWLLSAVELEAAQRKGLGATRERMLREMGEVIEALTADVPLMLVLEDLHWSDVATLDLLTSLARRREAARLLLIGTYRPVEVIVREHPLKRVKQELRMHKQCEELALEGLSEADVVHYLTVRFAAGAADTSPLRVLSRVIHRRTEGNPLFMVAMTDSVVAQGWIAGTEGHWELKIGGEEIEHELPESLHQMIREQIERLSLDEQRTLETASVVGMEFSAAAVAAGLEAEVEEVEERCEGLARREQFLRPLASSEWPDGTVASRYGFIHALYQQVLYERVTTGRRIRLHRRIGEREETAYGERVGEIATELAMHFEQGRDYRRAVQHLRQAAENALQRCANQEAINQLTAGLALLKTLPNTPERAQHELSLQVTLGVPLTMTKGYADPEVGNVFARARELCQHTGETPQLFPVLYGLLRFYVVRGELQAACEVGEQLLKLARKVQDSTLLLTAQGARGGVFFYRGELVSARPHLERCLAACDPQQHRLLTLSYGEDPRVVYLNFMMWLLWFLGYPDQALKKNDEVLSLAEALLHPLNLTGALSSAAMLHQLRREPQETRERAEAAMTLAAEKGFSYWLTQGSILRGWASAQQGQWEEGVAQMRQGLASYRATGAENRRSYYLVLLAEAYGKAGQPEEGLRVLAEALAAVDKSGERFCEAELYRLYGELSLRFPNSSLHSRTSHFPVSSPEDAFLTAIDIACRQSAKSLELRAVMSLSRLWQKQGKGRKARKLLAEVYGWFTEGFDTVDLQEAKELLAELQ